jgi:hexosaminidase
MKRLLILCFGLVQVVYAQQQQKTSINIIPQPVSVKQGPGHFVLDKKTVIAAKDEADRKSAQFLNDYLQQVYGFKLDIDKQEGKNYIRLSTKKFIKAPDKDSYTLQTTKEGITIEGDTYAGTFYGVQTLIQLLPVNNSKPQTPNSKLQIPLVSIQDHPRFNYRGMHLDVARHIFPLSFIKKYIDYLALHKMNYFHWHLTDDQGWRIEIKKYPELMSVGAYRNGTIIGRFPGKGNDNIRYGGYYTQDEVKEIVRYAADRHINVVPEIEMPGHASAAIAAYPWLSCFPDKPTVIPRNTPAPGRHQAIKLVQETWGVFEDVFCAGNDSTFSFLQGVIDEVLTLFPSQYIHVGGDECPKKHWKQCPKCQLRIKNENLKDEHELQSYFIQRMEKYINSKGRTIIGWDEILEGGLAPNAIVMSWRGEKGGIEAAKQNHYVIMTPTKPVYFDYSQSKNEDSVTIGSYNPVEAVYAYEPIPKELSKDKAKYVLGAQANLWTEYIKYPSKVEYMIFPRMSALSEVLWSPKEKKNWKDFERRLGTQFRRYDFWKANYSKAYYTLKVRVLPSDTEGLLKIEASTNAPHAKIRFNSISKESSLALPYRGPIYLYQPNSYLHLQLYKEYLDGASKYKQTELLDDFIKEFQINKATGKKINLKNQPASNYPGDGAFTLVNGVINEKGLSASDEFLGFLGTDLDATIDLGKAEKIKAIKLYVLDEENSWIHLPSSVEYYISKDGKKFERITDGSFRDVAANEKIRFFDILFSERETRYVKVVAKNKGIIPDGKPGAGSKAWLFVDEIQVY